MSEKKRKRTSDGASVATPTPHKKQATSFKHDTVSISWIEPDKSDLPPVLALATGFSAPDVTFKAYTNAKTARRSKPEITLHSSAHPRLDYTAKEEFGGGSDALLKHYIGVYDPETGDLKLVEARKVALRTTLRPSQEQLDRLKEEKIKDTYAIQRNELGMEFGTKKAKKYITSRSENAVIQPGAGTDPEDIKNDVVAREFLDAINAAPDDAPTRAQMAAAVEASKPKPNANLDATSPEEVYPIETLVGRDLLQLVDVQDWVTKIKSKEDVQTHSRYVSRRLLSLARLEDKTKLRVLRYMLILIEFYRMLRGSPGSKSRPKKLPKKDDIKKNLRAPDSLVENTLRRFSGNGEVTKWQSDFLITNLAAMTLYIEEFTTDTNDLKEDLRLEQKDMDVYFRELGAKVSPATAKDQDRLGLNKAEAKSHRMAKLILPLDFPKPKQEARARKSQRRF